MGVVLKGGGSSASSQRDYRSDSYRAKIAAKTQTVSVRAGSSQQATKTDPANNQTPFSQQASQNQLQSTATPQKVETATLQRPSFSNAFKGNQQTNKQQATNNNNDQPRSNSQLNSNSDSSSSSSQISPQAKTGGKDRLGKQAQNFNRIQERITAADEKVNKDFGYVPEAKGPTNYVRGIGASLVKFPTVYAANIGNSIYGAGIVATGYLNSETRSKSRDSFSDANKNFVPAYTTTLKEAYDIRRPEGAVNIALFAFGLRAYGKSAGTRVRPTEVKPQSLSSDIGVPKGRIGDPLLPSRTPVRNPSVVSDNIKVLRPRDPLSFSDVTAKGTIVERKAATPQQAQLYRKQTVDTARKTFRDPRFGREFRTDVLEDFSARSAADRIIGRKQSKGKLDSTGRKLLSEQERSTIIRQQRETLRTNRARSKVIEESRLAYERQRQASAGYKKSDLLGNKKGQARLTEVDYGNGLKQILERPQLKSVPRVASRLGPLFASVIGLRSSRSQGLSGAGSSTKPSQQADTIVGPVPAQDTRSASSSARKSVVRSAANVGTIVAVSQAQDAFSFSSFSLSSEQSTDFIKRKRSQEGGGLGGGRGGSSRSRGKNAYDPSLAGIEQFAAKGKVSKQGSASGNSGIRVRGVTKDVLRRVTRRGVFGGFI